jgi:hypothetical protein
MKLIFASGLILSLSLLAQTKIGGKEGIERNHSNIIIKIQSIAASNAVSCGIEYNKTKHDFNVLINELIKYEMQELLQSIDKINQDDDELKCRHSKTMLSKSKLACLFTGIKKEDVDEFNEIKYNHPFVRGLKINLDEFNYFKFILKKIVNERDF